MTIGNLKIRISMQGNEIKRDDQEEKGLKNNKKRESKKRGSEDFKIDIHAGKDIKRRRRIDYFSIREDCGRVLPARMIHTTRGWDCQKKLIIISSEQRNPGGSDLYQDIMNNSKTPPLHLHKEKESNCRSESHHSSSRSPRATIDALLSPTKALHAALLKKRYAHLIFKANHHQALMPLKQLGDNYKPDPQEEKERLQKQEIAEKARIEQEIEAAQTLLRMRADPEVKIQRQREREAARIALDKMEKTVEFNDALQIMRDFESLLNAPVC